ncbi:MAG: VCBS repeat-containing protein [Planctomycetes bacterium]|nr:VCBS repeat-containing protein [Planctomycetota bacterium]
MRHPFLPVTILLATTSGTCAQSVAFQPRADFGMAQENAQRCVVGDFDHDGNLDVAMTMEGYNAGKVEILFGDGQSDFGTSFDVISYVAWGIARGDWNMDGWDDLAATSYGWAQHGIRIWTNDHQGGLTAGVSVSTLATPPVDAIAGDFDGDGLPDLAAISEGGGWAVDWFHGNGNGTFSTFHPVPNTLGLTGRRIRAGHFDGDGLLDLVAIHATGAMVLRNNDQGLGVGYFGNSNGIPGNDPMVSAAVADLDGDGLDDIVTAGASLKAWLGVGNCQFALADVQPTSTGGNDTVLGDIDGDGRLDALVVGLGGAQIFFGQPGGMFSAPQNVPTGVWPKAGAIGDWNGDGWNDLAIVCQNYAGMDSYLAVHEQDPPAVTATAVTFGTGCGTPLFTMQPVGTALPLLGHTAAADLAHLPTALAGVAIGFSDQAMGALPLPAPLAGIGMPGCTLLQSTDVLGLPVTPLSATTARFSLGIPNQGALLGAYLFLQGHCFAPGANAMQFVVSNGVAWHLGNQ